MKTATSKLVKCKKQLSLLSGLVLSGLSGISHGFDLPVDARGSCPVGYVNVITTPFVPWSSTAEMEIYRLPENVCLKRYRSIDRSSQDTNFTVNSILPLNDSGAPVYRSMNGSEFSAENYEAVIGHFASGGSWANATNPSSVQYGNFKGVHPFLVAKNANAAIRYEGGQYLIEKQLRYADSAVGSCQPGYSTVDKTKTCYYKKNRIVKSKAGKAELLAPITVAKNNIGQECPLGMSTASNLGSHGGICTTNQFLFDHKALKTSGISPSQSSCRPEEMLYGTVCVPRFTAFYCTSNGGELLVSVTSRMSASHYDYPGKSTFGSLTTQQIYAFQRTNLALDRYNQFYTDFLFQTYTDPLQRIPVLHVWTGAACSDLDLDRGSFSVEPSPPTW